MSSLLQTRSFVPVLGLVSILSLSTVACDEETEETPVTGIDAALTQNVINNYDELVYANYQDSLTAAQMMDVSVDAMIDNPSEAAMGQARQSWLDAREPYLQTEVFRFYEGPIDNEEDGPEGLLNAWPLDENYIDYVQDNPDAGIINSDDALSATELEGLNEKGGEKNIATGYHAIEFLLWGQDLSADGPGDRSFTDYLSDGTGTAASQDRRGQYLAIVSDLLLDHLQQLVDAWAPSATYRTAFEADPEDGLRKIMTGMIILSGFETGGERLQTALDSGEQEDEHSCFSDNTHRDMVQDVVGVRNVWLGTYTRLDGTRIEGPGIKDIVTQADPDLAAELDSRINESVTLAEDLRIPFDQEIAPGNEEGRARVQALISSLRNQEELLGQVFVKLGLSIPVAE